LRCVLCYGDSNTWGYEPATGERFPEEVRWPGVLQKELGEGFRVIEEALNGRTTVHDDPVEEHRNGRTYLRPCMESHAPLDLVVIALGVNDLKARFGLSASDIADGVGALASIAKTTGAGPGGAPEVLLVVPPPVGKLTNAAQMFRGAEEKSRDLSYQYRRVAGQRGCALLDAGEVVEAVSDALEVAHPVAVRVHEGARVDLVAHPRAPQLRCARSRGVHSPPPNISLIRAATASPSFSCSSASRWMPSASLKTTTSPASSSAQPRCPATRRY
jgi:lysophospholipase L1-like esterase